MAGSWWRVIGVKEIVSHSCRNGGDIAAEAPRGGSFEAESGGDDAGAWR